MRQLPQHLVIGNPENRRVKLFVDALRRKGAPAAKVLSYESLLADIDLLKRLPSSVVVRLDSPGENFAVERQLIARGADTADKQFSWISAKDAVALDADEGRIRCMHQWYCGYRSLLASIEETLGSSATFYNHPAAVQTMFNKRECHRILRENDIPTARLLGDLHSYDAMIELMEEQRCSRVFVKPVSGSSASGVLAIARSGNKVKAHGSVLARDAGRQMNLYNTLRIQQYRTEDELRPVVDQLALEDCIIEQWLPKASISRRMFDFRVLVIKGKATHVVARLSRSPMTNLHLGNERGELAELKALLGVDSWHRMLACAEDAAGCFPLAFYVGVDIMVTRAFSPYVLEVNAFGDLIPRVLSNGLSTYECEVEEMMKSKIGERAVKSDCRGLDKPATT